MLHKAGPPLGAFGRWLGSGIHAVGRSVDKDQAGRAKIRHAQPPRGQPVEGGPGPSGGEARGTAADHARAGSPRPRPGAGRAAGLADVRRRMPPVRQGGESARSGPRRAVGRSAHAPPAPGMELKVSAIPLEPLRGAVWQARSGYAPLPTKYLRSRAGLGPASAFVAGRARRPGVFFTQEEGPKLAAAGEGALPALARVHPDRPAGRPAV